MSTEKVRSTKLKFKGEKTKKKRKRDNDDDEVGRVSGSKRKDEEEDPETWVLPDNPHEIRGPTFIIHPSDPSPVCMNFNAAAARIVLHLLDKEKLEGGTEPPTLLDRTPTDVSQVWVTTRVAGSPTVNLRTGTGEGKFLSCDTHGLVSADRDARGPQEEWTPVIMPDGMVAFMNVYEKYLSVDEVAGGTLQLRGDSEEVGFGERFWVKIQSKYKKEANEEEKKKDGKTSVSKINETSSNQLYQTWGAGRIVTSQEDKKELKRARKEGRLAEAMLDRRSKLKRFVI
ncbi:FRG1-like family-domain-containing protein [Collybia nuda]|uniref:FRG1-like family-domain-containing protein n=1 Tax=Collybia nuda TaxID=64659 RepID=A0A9P6CQM7_9AGAR|nr:FRG1-like family-domain-containing protein [Collybia nuda]